MKFLVSADNTGSVKEVTCNRDTDTSKKDGKPAISVKNYCQHDDINYKQRIVKLVDFQATYLVGARLGGKVSIYDLIKPEVEEPEEPTEEGEEPKAPAVEPELYTLLHVYELDVTPEDKPVAAIAIDSLDSILVAFESSKVFLIHFESDGFEYPAIQINLPEPKSINCFVKDPESPGVFAYGGEENDVKIVRLFAEDTDFKVFSSKNVSFTPEILFTAENVENDYLDMRVPVWIKQIIFLRSEDKSHFKFITGTKYGQLRVYNTAEEAEPIADYKVTDKPIISMVLANEETQEEVILTDSHNLIAKHHLIKVNKNGYKIHSASAGTMTRPVAKLMGKFTEGANTGAIFALENGNNEILVTGGLDRYLRVYDIVSRKMLAKVYTGVEISSVVILNIANEKYVPKAGSITRKRRRDIQKAEAGEDEDLWAQLEDPKKTKGSK